MNAHGPPVLLLSGAIAQFLPTCVCVYCTNSMCGGECVWKTHVKRDVCVCDANNIICNPVDIYVQSGAQSVLCEELNCTFCIPHNFEIARYTHMVWFCVSRAGHRLVMKVD